MTATPFSPARASCCPTSPRDQELVLLARTLWHEGYDDHLAGHITYRQPDGTLLCNPWLLLWEELRPDDVLRIDLDGTVLEGRWPVPPGIPLHLELHRRRPDVVVAVHSHPRFATVWADLGTSPRVLRPELGPRRGRAGAGRRVRRPGRLRRRSPPGPWSPWARPRRPCWPTTACWSPAASIRAAHQRAVALEYRSRRAWQVEAVGSRPRAARAGPVLLPGLRRRRVRRASSRPWPAASSAGTPTASSPGGRAQ